jgi:hypothetical protein
MEPERPKPEPAGQMNRFRAEASPPEPSTNPISDLGTPFGGREIEQPNLANCFFEVFRLNGENRATVPAYFAEHPTHEAAAALSADPGRQEASDPAVR